MRRNWGIGCLGVLGMGLALRVMTSQPSEPVYAGKTVDQWLDAGYEDASMALHEIGPPAVPYIVAKLSREDPRCGSLRRYQELWRRFPPALRMVLPKPKSGNFDELRACSALLELGPRIIALLSTGLQDQNPIVREVSAHALGSFREQGRKIDQSVPFLVEALRDSDPKVRTRAAQALDGIFEPHFADPVGWDLRLETECFGRCRQSYPQGTVPGVLLGSLPASSP
jgi:HEAT repeat protein